MVVGVAGDRALEQALLDVDRRIRVEAAVRPAAELDALARRLGDERDGMAAAGFSSLMIAVDHGRGVVDVDVVGRARPEAAAVHFLDRYGEAVAVRWVAPSRLAERPRAFASWTSEGRMLRVFSAIDHNGERRGSATLEHEDQREVAVAVTCFAPVGPHTLIGGIQRQHHDLELSAPVGDRRVIDAATGEARPSVDELGVR